MCVFGCLCVKVIASLFVCVCVGVGMCLPGECLLDCMITCLCRVFACLCACLFARLLGLAGVCV